MSASLSPASPGTGRNEGAVLDDVMYRRQASILIVDDEAGIRSFLQRALAKQYGLVEVAESAEAAEELRQRYQFDLLIVDIRLPGRSGLEWVEDLRRHGNDADVIFITAYAELNATISALRFGASDFILKPFRLEQILASIERCLQRRLLQQENSALRRQVGDGRGWSGSASVRMYSGARPPGMTSAT